MTNIKQPPTERRSKQGHYQVGLSRVKEDVISAHFMDKLIQACENVNFAMQTSTNALTISMKQVDNQLLPLLLKASDEFVKNRVNAAKRRARKNHARYNLSSPDKVGLAEYIVELMYDRQFLKGKKSNYCYKTLLYQVKQRVNSQQAIQMILPALPFKSPSVLKCIGLQPDLCEVHFLLCLYEITKAIDCLYREYKDSTNVMASFLVICDGNRFNKICHVSSNEVDAYQKTVQFWIDKLNIQDYVKLTDYTSSIASRLPKEVYQQKIKQREDNIALYKTVMLPLFDPSQIKQSICHAINADPFPEGSHPDGRFIPLFRSLIHTINYPCLLEFTNHNWSVYKRLYCYLITHIYHPIGSQQSGELLLENIKPLKQVLPSINIHELENLRINMLKEAWVATIHYIAEIKSDRDLPNCPILLCFPSYLRWTIHEKPGQLAILTTTAAGHLIQPWHGSGVIRKTKKDKVKIYPLPSFLLKSEHAMPVHLSDDSSYQKDKQPFFFIDKNTNIASWQQLLEVLKQHLTRERKC